MTGRTSQTSELPVGANFAESHVVRSRMALNKHQIGVALQEAERALEFNANDVDALKAKAGALIYSGKYEEGRKIAIEAAIVFVGSPGVEPGQAEIIACLVVPFRCNAADAHLVEPGLVEIQFPVKRVNRG